MKDHQKCIDQLRQPVTDPTAAAIFYLGQESVVLSTAAVTLAVDPYLSDYVDKKASGPVPWKRNYPAPVTAEELAPCLQYVFCTHDHCDHTDPWTIPLLAEHNPSLVFFASRAFSDRLLQLGVAAYRIVPVDAGKVYEYPGFSFVGIPAAHEELHLTDKGYAEMSFRFSLHTDGGDTVIFHGGDCCMYDGLTEAIGYADVMMLPVNGRDYYKLRENVIGNLTAREAVLLSDEIGADMLIPLHYDLYPNNGLPATDFVNAVLTTSLKFHLFRPGERMIYKK